MSTDSTTSPQRSEPGNQVANAPTMGPPDPSATPVLDQAGKQQGASGNRPASGVSESRMSAAEATQQRLAKDLNNGRTGAVSAWLRVGIERRLGKLASIGLELGLKLAVNFDNDRRVRASVTFDVTFKASVDLLLFKAGLSFRLGSTTAAVWNSPEHFYAYLQQCIAGVEKAAETYVSKKAGAGGKGESMQGERAPTPTLDGTPSLSVNTSEMGADLSLEKGKLLKRVPWLSAVGSVQYEVFTASRTKDGKLQQLHGTVARGITKLQSGIGSAEVEYSYTENHPNPDQNGVFWDLRVELGRGNAPKVKASEIKALKGQMQGWSQAAGTNPIAKAKAWLKAAEAAMKAAADKAAKAPNKALKVQPDVTLNVHVQWNGATEANTLRFVHVHQGTQVVAKGELPLGAATLTGELGVRRETEVLEILGTHTLAYTKNVYNGFKRRHDHPKGWNAWVSRHKDALWVLFGQVNVAGSQPSKEVQKRLEAAAGQARQALTQREIDEAVLATLLAAATRDFEEAGNDAKQWKTVVDPKKPVTAEAHVSGAAGKKATYGKVKILGGRLVRKPKTLRDVHDQGVPIQLHLPHLKSTYRGAFQFKGRQPTFASDMVKGLKGHFPSRGRQPVGAYLEQGVDSLFEGFPQPTHPSDFDRMGSLADRLLDGMIEGVVDPSDPTAP